MQSNQIANLFALQTQQISGFYGPGAWAAWIITILSSWIPFYQTSSKGTAPYIAYALYTNWASIDTFRHVLIIYRSADDVQRMYSTNVVIAANAINLMGALHASLQLSICFANWTVEMNVTRRRQLSSQIMVLTTGLILPAAGTLLGTSIYMTRMSNSDWATFFVDLATKNFDTCILSLTTMCVTNAIVAAMFLFPEAWLAEYFAHTGLGAARFGAVLSLLGLLIHHVVLGVVAQVRQVDQGHLAFMRQCFVFPCTGISISELDQAFSLFVAVVVFLHTYRLAIHQHVWDVMTREKMSSRADQGDAQELEEVTPANPVRSAMESER